jgi:hypothetical protein
MLHNTYIVCHVSSTPRHTIKALSLGCLPRAYPNELSKVKYVIKPQRISILDCSTLTLRHSRTTCHHNIYEGVSTRTNRKRAFSSAVNCLIVMYLPFSVFCVLLECKCVLYCCHRVSTHLRLNIHI